MEIIQYGFMDKAGSGDFASAIDNVILTKKTNTVVVYQLDTNNNLKQLGQDINGEAAGDQSGYSVSLSADGNRLAIGSPLNDGNGNDSGSVSVYELDSSNNWQKLGLNINGEAAGDQLGYSVSLSADGNRVAIGSPLNDGSGNDSGSVRVYINRFY